MRWGTENCVHRGANAIGDQWEHGRKGYTWGIIWWKTNENCVPRGTNENCVQRVTLGDQWAGRPMRWGTNESGEGGVHIIGPPSHWFSISLVPHLIDPPISTTHFIGPPSHWSPRLIGSPSHWPPISLVPFSLVPQFISPPLHYLNSLVPLFISPPIFGQSQWYPISLVPHLIGPPV